MPSQKTIVIEYLFDKHWDAEANVLSKTLMSLDDVADGIRACRQAGVKLSDKNPANFLKDLLRGGNSSKNWPQSVTNRRFTGVQRTGEGECFEFIPFKEGQVDPFPDDFPVRAEAPTYGIQSISIPLVTKSLGRSDETWLIQVAINLRVVESYFAIAGKHQFLELAHLQIGIKLRATEIDALFLGRSVGQEKSKTTLVTCEAKQAKDPLIPSQIINQAQAAFAANEDVEFVVPIGLRAIKGQGYYIAEFEAVTRETAAELAELALVGDAIFTLRPPIKGI
jgi:hypothetical protein